MSDELTRAKARGAKVTTIPKQVSVSELATIAAEMRAMAEAQQRSQQIMIEMLANVVAAVEGKQVNFPDLKPLVDAVKALKQESVTESNTMLCDYQFSGERDARTNLIKLDTLKIVTVPKEVH